ncbi:MAG TPA: DMT family transporter [Bacteroidales bacterium]
MNSKGNTIFWAIVACLLWSTAYAGIKLGLQFDTPFHFAGIRFIISGLMILPFTVRPSVYLVMIRDNWKVVAWVTTLQIVINYSLFYQGLNLVPGALGAVIYGAQPLIIALVAAVLHKDDKLTKNKIITIVFGLSGVIFISVGRQAFKFGTGLEILGVFLLLTGNVATATSNVIISLKSKAINPFVLSSSSLFLGGVILYLISIPVETKPLATLPLKYWMILLWLSFMAASAFSIWYKLLQRPGVKVSELNFWKFINPLTGAVLSWLLIPGEKPDWLTITGMVIITASLVIYYSNTDRTLKPHFNNSK